MTDFSQIDQMHGDLIALRRGIHAHPETAFEENRTAQIVAEKLEEFGLEVATGIGKTGVVGSLKCGSGNRYSPEMINTPLETDTAVSVAKSLVGDKNVVDGCEPILAAEDFAYLLEEWGGCYILIGNGKGEQNKGGCMIHNPGYDFNDDIIPLGVKYWVELAETLMPEENPVAAE
jgi:metal-dependent amidase/aminoacylase/carboxypeptidase family protein